MKFVIIHKEEFNFRFDIGKIDGSTNGKDYEE